jgi:hypothetical protein
MTDETFLADQAYACADTLLARVASQLRGVPGAEAEAVGAWLELVGRGFMRPLLAAAWLEGRQAGGDEAKAIVRRMVADLGES